MLTARIPKQPFPDEYYLDNFIAVNPEGRLKPSIGVLALDNVNMLEHLEALAHTLGIPIRYEHMEGETTFPSGGLCRIKGNPVIIVNMSAATGEKVRTIAHALRRFDLSQVYLKPALRDFLEKSDSHRQNSKG